MKLIFVHYFDIVRQQLFLLDVVFAEEGCVVREVVRQVEERILIVHARNAERDPQSTTAMTDSTVMAITELVQNLRFYERPNNEMDISDKFFVFVQRPFEKQKMEQVSIRPQLQWQKNSARKQTNTKVAVSASKPFPQPTIESSGISYHGFSLIIQLNTVRCQWPQLSSAIAQKEREFRKQVEPFFKRFDEYSRRAQFQLHVECGFGGSNEWQKLLQCIREHLHQNEKTKIERQQRKKKKKKKNASQLKNLKQLKSITFPDLGRDGHVNLSVSQPIDFNFIRRKICYTLKNKFTPREIEILMENRRMVGIKRMKERKGRLKQLLKTSLSWHVIPSNPPPPTNSTHSFRIFLPKLHSGVKQWPLLPLLLRFPPSFIAHELFRNVLVVIQKPLFKSKYKKWIRRNQMVINAMTMENNGNSNSSQEMKVSDAGDDNENENGTVRCSVFDGQSVYHRKRYMLLIDAGDCRGYRSRVPPDALSMHSSYSVPANQSRNQVVNAQFICYHLRSLAIKFSNDVTSNTPPADAKRYLKNARSVTVDFLEYENLQTIFDNQLATAMNNQKFKEPNKYTVYRALPVRVSDNRKVNNSNDNDNNHVDGVDGVDVKVIVKGNGCYKHVNVYRMIFGGGVKKLSAAYVVIKCKFEV